MSYYNANECHVNVTSCSFSKLTVFFKKKLFYCDYNNI